MRRRSFRFPEASAALAIAFFAALPTASAQPCCAGAAAIGPGRLVLGEDALVGVQVMTTDIFGSFDPKGAYIASPSGTSEIDFEEAVLGTVRVLSSAQVSIFVPIEETWRRTPGRSEAGGGFGDLQLALRYDAIEPGSKAHVPGVAFSIGAIFPTGRSPEGASSPLSTDATGTGAFQGTFAIAFEQTFGHLLLSVTGSSTFHDARMVGDVRSQQGLDLAISGAGGYAFDSGGALALTASYSAGLDTRVNGGALPDSARARTRLGVAGGFPFGSVWRTQGTLFGDVPIARFGKNDPLGAGLTFMLVRTFS